METRRLKLRPIETTDAEFLFQLMTTPQWHEMIGDRGVYTLEDTVEYIENRMDPDLSKKGFVNHVMLEKETGVPVGTCSLHDRDAVAGIDIGYAIHSRHEGKGYATEGAKEMVRLAFEKFEINQVHVITDDKNIGSCRVLEKIGFNFTGYIKLPNASKEIRQYTLERSNWTAG